MTGAYKTRGACLETELRSLRQQLEEANKHISNLQKKNQQAEMDLIEVRNRLASAKEDNLSLSSMIRRVQNRNTHLESIRKAVLSSIQDHSPEEDSNLPHTIDYLGHPLSAFKALDNETEPHTHGLRTSASDFGGRLLLQNALERSVLDRGPGCTQSYGVSPSERMSANANANANANIPSSPHLNFRTLEGKGMEGKGVGLRGVNGAAGSQPLGQGATGGASGSKSFATSEAGSGSGMNMGAGSGSLSQNDGREREREGGASGQGGATDGRSFFRAVRQKIEYERFQAFIGIVRQLNAKQLSRSECLQKAREIFGADHQDLIEDFNRMLARHPVAQPETC